MVAQQLSNKPVKEFSELVLKMRPYLLFTALNTAGRVLDKQGQSILDIGCGRGEPIRFINRHGRFFTVGVDAFEPYLRECQRCGTHNEYVLCDIRRLPFRRKSFDVVLCLEVLEHLEKEEGKQLIDTMEGIASKQVIISTPIGEYEQHTYDGNPYQEHSMSWSPAELKELGYRVRGHGISHLGGETGLVSRLPKTLGPLADIIYILAGPLVYFLPQLAGHVVCSKKLKSSGMTST